MLALSACRKELGPPSEEYEEARQRFSKIYGQKLDEAFIDPEMDEIDALLQQVPAESMDAQSAKELQQRIKDGRARMERARQEREDAIASAQQPDTTFPSSPREPDAPPPAPAPQGPNDAGPSTEGPVTGSPASELVAGYLGCFQRAQPITIRDRGSREAWEMSDRARCSQSFPSFVGQVVLIEDGKVLTVISKSSVQVTYQNVDAGPAPGATPPAP
ncbi:MAG TPA: hypothetical protein VNA24_35570 [Hyalangium sp.]|nr:hypothetical protein [Hyalangium sp.]